LHLYLISGASRLAYGPGMTSKTATCSTCWRAVISRRYPEPSLFHVVGSHGGVATNPLSQRKSESCRETGERESVPLRTNQLQGSGLRRSLKETGGVGPGSLPPSRASESRGARSKRRTRSTHTFKVILQGHSQLWHFRGFCLRSLSTNAPAAPHRTKAPISLLAPVDYGH